MLQERDGLLLELCIMCIWHIWAQQSGKNAVLIREQETVWEVEDLLDGTGDKALGMSVDFHIGVSSQASLKTLSTEALVAYAFVENIFFFPDPGCLSRCTYLFRI